MTRETCAFCRIVDRVDDRPWVMAHGDEVISFKPARSLTRMHRLFVPTRHVLDAAENPALTGMVFAQAAMWAAGRDAPFKLLTNSGRGAGQTVYHLHVHYIPYREGGHHAH